jgi:hypothetical protein
VQPRCVREAGTDAAQTACRGKREATWCVGEAQFLVKATPLGVEKQREAARRYGIAYERPRRFALCKVWALEDVGFKCTPQFRGSAAGRAFRGALAGSGLLRTDEEFNEFIGRVEQRCAVFRQGAPVTPCGVPLVAVPLDAAFRDGPWRVEPLVAIRPQTTFDGLQALWEKCKDQEAKNAIRANARGGLYFTHTYGLSGQS